MNSPKVRLATLLAALLCTLTACTRNEVAPEQEEHTLTFSITNYMQYDLDEGTRATPVATTTALEHLALAVFDEASGKQVGDMQVQDKGSEGYGTFTATLPYGRYRLVFLGYSGSKACHISSPEAISFDDNYVPHTFLSTSTLTVDASTPAQSGVTLHRAVAAFKMHMEDAIPAQATAFRCKASGGGMTLNALTGLAAKRTGRESDISISDKLKGETGRALTLYLYLASDPEPMNITVSAVDAQGTVLASRDFTDVPMQVNKLTVYKGRFFDGQAYGFGIEVDDEWGATEERDF